MNRVHVVSQNISNDTNMISGKHMLKFFYNKENNGETAWYSSDLIENIIEPPEATISYIKNDLKVDFFLRLVYD